MSTQMIKVLWPKLYELVGAISLFLVEIHCYLCTSSLLVMQILSQMQIKAQPLHYNTQITIITISAAFTPPTRSRT